MGPERGSASIVLVVFLALSLATTAAVAAIARVATSRARVTAAADLAALAAARTQDCAEAIRIARGNGADVVECRSDGTDMVVSAAMSVQLFPGREALLRATARAGPPER